MRLHGPEPAGLPIKLQVGTSFQAEFICPTAPLGTRIRHCRVVDLDPATTPDDAHKWVKVRPNKNTRAVWIPVAKIVANTVTQPFIPGRGRGL